jgi:hypothetical protein
MLVPEADVVPLPIASEIMPTPGAMISVTLLLLVKAATTSLSFVAPTEMTLLKQAGEVIFTPELLLPEEAKAITPLARRVFIAAAPAIL